MWRTKKTVLIALILVALVAASFAAGCVLGTRAETQTGGLETIDQAWNIIFHDYVDKSKLDASALSQAAIKGMVTELNDPHTAYIDPDTLKLSLSGFEGKFEGIGAQVGMKEEKIIIMAPLPDTPAEKAGVRAGDVILEVDGRSTSGLSLMEVVTAIRGPKGTAVRLHLLHPGESEPVTIEIVRDEINISSVDFEMRDNIAYIRISHFSERTAEELAPIIIEISQSQASGVVLDMRSNPGGILQTVIDVAGYFLREGVVVEVVDNQGNHTTSSVKPASTVIDLPMVALVDEYSASGSEVLAGALQDHGRAKIAGTTTFGKGSVNILRQLGDGSGLYITTARWLTPKGRLIEGKGLEPDIKLELTGDEAIQWAINYLKDG